jgi:hypothetical protein
MGQNCRPAAHRRSSCCTGGLRLLAVLGFWACRAEYQCCWVIAASKSHVAAADPSTLNMPSVSSVLHVLTPCRRLLLCCLRGCRAALSQHSSPQQATAQSG